MKIKFYGIFCLMVLGVSCNSSHNDKTVESSCHLSALNLSGPVKEVIYEGLYVGEPLDILRDQPSFTFDKNGRPINQETLDGNIYFLNSFPGCFSIGINKDKIQSLRFSIFRAGEWTLFPTKFNSDGLAIELKNIDTKSVFKVSYRDFDNYGNWTTMLLKCIRGSSNDGILKIPEKITRQISYYQKEEPSLSSCPLPSEDYLKIILNKAIYYDISVMGEQLAYYVPRYLDSPGTSIWDGGLKDSNRGKIIFQPGTQDWYADCTLGEISLHQASKQGDKYYVPFSYKILLTDDYIKDSKESEVISEKYSGLALIKYKDGDWIVEDIGNGQFTPEGYKFGYSMFKDMQEWEIGSLLENALIEVNQLEAALRDGSLVQNIINYCYENYSDSVTTNENISRYLKELEPYQNKYM